jgi:hypothetical protein
MSAVPDGVAKAITTTLATTPPFDVRRFRAFLLRSSSNVTVSVFASREENAGYKAVRIGGSVGSDLEINLVDQFVSFESEVTTALFGCHFLKFVSGSGTPTVELMGKA